MVFAAANEEYLKMSKVIKSPADEFFTFINFLQRKNELDRARIRNSIKK